MDLKTLLETIIDSKTLHAKWLNTLSYLENCGARKIAACEHPTLVKEEMLKHAAEEFRHAHSLKKQIGKITDQKMESYTPSLLLGGRSTLSYLQSLDLQTCRYLKKSGLQGPSLKEAAYLLVTYAIELRAEALYPLYHTALKGRRSPVAVKSIVLEEKEHLKEMEEGLKNTPSGFSLARYVCGLENALYHSWMDAVSAEVFAFDSENSL